MHCGHRQQLRRRFLRHSMQATIYGQAHQRETKTMASSTFMTSALQDDSLICSLCLEVYRCPKLLPCLHTVCKGCVQTLVECHDPEGSIDCPVCSKVIRVPPGGASAFQDNVYLKRTDLERARKGLRCLKHKRNLELHCIQCDEPICIICQMTRHKDHSLQDMTHLYSQCKSQLKKDLKELDEEVGSAKTLLVALTAEQQAVRRKDALLKRIIHNRHMTMVEAAAKCRDEALASLDTITEEMQNVLEVELFSLQENLQKLNKLQQRVQQALDSGPGCELVTVAREMRCGRGSEEAVQKLTTKPMTTVCRPVLRSSATVDITLQRMREYMGSAAKMEMTVSAPEVEVVGRFRCGEGPGTEVYSLCPLDNGTIDVSYETSCLKESGVSEELSGSGTVLSRWAETGGRRSWKSLGGGESMFVTCRDNVISTFSKSLTPFCLEATSPGEAKVIRVEVLSREPLVTNDVIDFSINCGPFRAFDVHVIEQLFVVLQEAQAPDTQRTVRLYRHSQPDAIHTYSPPVQPFQPSDVCFYTLGGQEVLLVADELNDAIHVVKVQDGRLSFARYLAPGCPLLVQPTALNTDTEGRLWVACRGGKLLTCEPIA